MTVRLALLSLTLAAGTANAVPATTIFIAGDSTAAAYGSGPHQGWGVPLEQFFDPALVKIDNRARGGRSSRTFITDGHWETLIADVKAGDFVLIQFGQNDGGAINEEPPGSTRPLRARGVLPGLGDESEEIDNAVTKKREIVRTFGWYMRRMIAEVRERGATPVIFSPTVHNTWVDGKVMRGPERFRMWSREIARKEGVPFVDHSRLIADEYQRLGEAAVGALFPRDHVHTGPEGAELNARLAVSGLAGLRGVDFKRLLSDAGRAVAPDPIGWLNLPEPADPAIPSIVLIGDSTVRNGGGDGAGGQWGWGEPLAELIDPACANVVNRAIGGLSSRTFLTQGHWERALTLIKPGDWVLMQFGHNDGGPLNDDSRARGTIRGTGGESEEIDNMLTGAHETVHTYGWYLRRYIREARERGAIPVVCTPVPRKTWNDGRIVRSSPDGYAAWAAQVALEEGAFLIDLNSLIAARYDGLGPEAVDALFADPHTHTSRAGAELNARIVFAALQQLDGFPCAVAFGAN
jgi:lysophospholipase L1-like esterase